MRKGDRRELTCEDVFLVCKILGIPCKKVSSDHVVVEDKKMSKEEAARYLVPRVISKVDSLKTGLGMDV